MLFVQHEFALEVLDCHVIDWGARVDDLPKTQVLTTFLAGKVVYQIASPLDSSRDAGGP